MDERDIQHILIEILGSQLKAAEPRESIKASLTPDVLSAVYRLAKKHDLAHIVSDFVYRNKLETEIEAADLLKREELTAFYRCEQLKYAYREICEAFDKAEIAYVPLKGSVIRPYYPNESVRTSCDIDILIHEADIEAAVECLTMVGYDLGERHYHEVSLYSTNKIHLELHFSIKENMESIDKVLDDAWGYAERADGSRYDFKKEFFVFHMYAHMAYHFLSGGCGIRSLMDIWVMEHKMDADYTLAEDLLKRAGIYKFAYEMSKIANKCFGEEGIDTSSDMILKYIFRGGMYGSSKNSLAVKTAETGSLFAYTLKRLFLPYESMKVLYPILKKVPILLPFCYVARWLGVIFGRKTKRIASEISFVSSISGDNIAEIKEIRRNLGLD